MSEPTDTLTKVGAQRLATNIQNYWHSRGYDRVRAESCLIEGTENAWGTRSNLRAGMPPGVTNGKALVRWRVPSKFRYGGIDFDLDAGTLTARAAE